MVDQQRRHDRGIDLARSRTANHHLTAIQAADTKDVASDGYFAGVEETPLNRRNLTRDSQDAHDGLRLDRARSNEKKKKEEEPVPHPFYR